MNALIQVWAKGFNIAGRSGEFDLVVPDSKAPSTPLEETVRQFHGWGALLEPLYRLSPTTLARQFIILFASNELLVGALAASKDGHRRSSIVFITAAVSGFDWRDQSLALLFARTFALTTRLANRYGEILAGVPADVRKQVNDNTFLPNREFPLEQEVPDKHLKWNLITEEVRRWKGIDGIATPPLAGLGANVLYGTRDEINRADTSSIAGVFDIARGRIEPIENRLELWAKSTALTPATALDTPTQAIPADSLGELHEALQELVRLVTDLKSTLMNIERRLSEQQDVDAPRKKGKWGF